MDEIQYSPEQINAIYDEVVNVFGQGLTYEQQKEYASRWDDICAKTIAFAEANGIDLTPDLIFPNKEAILATPNPLEETSIRIEATIPGVKTATQKVEEHKISDYTFKKYLLMGLALIAIAILMGKYVKVAAGFILAFCVIAFYLIHTNKTKEVEEKLKNAVKPD